MNATWRTYPLAAGARYIQLRRANCSRCAHGAASLCVQVKLADQRFVFPLHQQLHLPALEADIYGSRMSIFPCACSGAPTSVGTVGSWAPTVEALSRYGQTIPHAPGVLAQVSGGGGKPYPLMSPITPVTATKIQAFSPACWRPYDVFTVASYAPSTMAVVNPYRAQHNLVHGRGDLFAHHPSRKQSEVADAAVAADATGLAQTSALAQLAATGDAEPFATVDPIAQMAMASGAAGDGVIGGGASDSDYGIDPYRGGGFGGRIDQIGPMYYANGCGCCRNPRTPLDPSGYAAWKDIIAQANIGYQQFAPDCLANAVSKRVFGMFNNF